MMTMIISPTALLVLLGLASVVYGATASDSTPTAAPERPVCSCSPTKFTFVLSLDQTCENNDIEDNTGGIIGSFCFTETDVALPEYVTDEDGEEDEDTTDSTETESIRRKYRTRTLQTASTNTTDPVTEIVSVQFLEFDTSGDLTVINQDDTYADVSLSNTDTLTFYSASSFLDPDLTLEEQMSSPALVPGGASLILWGKTESGEIVRNRFFWMYDTENCGTDNIPIKMDDEIGWVSVAEISNAWPEFCPAVPEGSPTISPRTNEPTMVPSHMPTSMSMSISMSMSMPKEEAGWGSDGYDTPAPTEAPTHSPVEQASWNGDGYDMEEEDTETPSASPVESPTCSPTVSEAPTESPTEEPTESPTQSPETEAPTKSPTRSPVTPEDEDEGEGEGEGEDEEAGDEAWTADGWTGDGNDTDAPTVAPTSKSSSLEGWGGSSGIDPAFGSKTAKTHKPDTAKSSKSGKGSKSVEGKTGKEDGWEGAYGMGQLTSYNVMRSSGSMSSSGLAMITLVVMSVLFARQ